MAITLQTFKCDLCGVEFTGFCDDVIGRLFTGPGCSRCGSRHTYPVAANPKEQTRLKNLYKTFWEHYEKENENKPNK